MINKILFFCALMTILSVSNAAPMTADQQSNTIQQLMNKFSSVDNKMGTNVSRTMLPAPYDYLLTQPLMTIGIEKYYQRTPIIQTIYAHKNRHNNTYYRAIKMLVDSNKVRNNAKLAQNKKEEIVVELAFITMNFNELPKKIIADVLNTNVPFGKLLTANQLQTASKDRTYFAVSCDKAIALLINCNLNSKVYGRTNTIIRKDNKKWLARVVELLPGSH